MSKTITFRGILAEGLEQKIKLSTLDGKQGYKIVKFQTMSSLVGANEYETMTNDQKAILEDINNYQTQGAGSTGVDFSESDLLAASYIEDNPSHAYPLSETIFFDNEVFNQDIFVNTASLTGTVPVNYYIELETVKLTDVQSTQLTLKSLRQIASR